MYEISDCDPPGNKRRTPKPQTEPQSEPLIAPDPTQVEDPATREIADPANREEADPWQRLVRGTDDSGSAGS